MGLSTQWDSGWDLFYWKDTVTSGKGKDTWHKLQRKAVEDSKSLSLWNDRTSCSSSRRARCCLLGKLSGAPVPGTFMRGQPGTFCRASTQIPRGKDDISHKHYLYKHWGLVSHSHQVMVGALLKAIFWDASQDWPCQRAFRRRTVSGLLCWRFSTWLRSPDALCSRYSGILK